jgi:cyclomaltodextrinase / maltogenic alpha-amylase / neopullulanase
MTVPSWVQDAVFYQIFPDRFANGDPANDPPNIQAWGAVPTIWGYQGGDFKGIIQHFDYILDLGANAIYLNPIFLATSNHRYNTTDYYRIDPKLGNISDFRELLSLAHQNGVKVILDGVFNHCGRGFFAFNDILENQIHSPYLDWFHVRNFPVDAYATGDARDYLAWWNIKSLPKFNTDNPDVRQYLLNIARYWIDEGIDGWRLDVPNEIDDDAFWAEFRQVVRSANPDAYILGEIWNVEPRWVGENHFDGIMNYPFRDAVLRLLQTGTLDIPHFMQRIEELQRSYPVDNVNAMYLPLGSHDTERLATKLEGNQEKIRLAFLIQFTFPGTPAIYYGDEIGLQGEKDPDCRRAFPWQRDRWDQPLREWVKKMVALRKEQPALRRGNFERLCSESQNGCCAYLRSYQGSTLLVIVNASAESRLLQVPVSWQSESTGRNCSSLLYNHHYVVEHSHFSVSLPPWSGEVIQW